MSETCAKPERLQAKVGTLLSLVKDREIPTLSAEDACRLAAKLDDYTPKEGEYIPPEVGPDYEPAKDEILITGNREFVHFNLARVRGMIDSGEIVGGDLTKVRLMITGDAPITEQEKTGTPVVGSEAFRRRLAGLPEPDVPGQSQAFTDAQYRAALRTDDEVTPPAVKKAIRKFFADREKKETTSTARRFIPSPKNKLGRPIPFVSEEAYKKPKNMSARQFKRSKKQFRKATAIVEAALATMSAT